MFPKNNLKLAAFNIIRILNSKNYIRLMCKSYDLYYPANLLKGEIWNCSILTEDSKSFDG